MKKENLKLLTTFFKGGWDGFEGGFEETHRVLYDATSDEMFEVVYSSSCSNGTGFHKSTKVNIVPKDQHDVYFKLAEKEKDISADVAYVLEALCMDSLSKT